MPVNPNMTDPPASLGSPVREAAERNLAAMDAQRALHAANAAVNAPPPLVPGTTEERFTDGEPLPSLPPIPEPGGDEPDPDAPLAEDAEQEEAARPDLAGKRVVLFLDIEHHDEGWRVIEKQPMVVNRPEPLLYDGTRDEAIRSALDDERNEKLADVVRKDPERFLLVSVPASSWAPAPVKPKVTKTTWIVVR